LHRDQQRDKGEARNTEYRYSMTWPWNRDSLDWGQRVAKVHRDNWGRGDGSEPKNGTLPAPSRLPGTAWDRNRSSLEVGLVGLGNG
jgi:hypothetical protein